MIDRGSGRSLDQRMDGWPTSARLAIGVVSVACLGLLVVVLSSQESDEALREWLAVVAAFIGVPVAVWISQRQLTVAIDSLALQRHQVKAEEGERTAAREDRVRRLRDAVQVRVEVDNVVDCEVDAISAEGDAVARWREEITQRGWKSDSPGRWTRNGDSVATAELLRRETSPILPRPWIVKVVASSQLDSPANVEQIRIRLNGDSRTLAAEGAPLPPGATVEWRLTESDGSAATFATESAAGNHVAGVVARVTYGGDATEIEVSGTSSRSVAL